MVVYTVYALPAIISLPSGIRPGLQELTIDEAVDSLKETGLRDMQLVESARKLVAQRMEYCRRNSYDSFDKAFRRGYGFCQQQAFALASILQKLGYSASPVQAYRTQFPDGNIGGHAWVSVHFNGGEYYIDPVYYDEENKEFTCIPRSEITGFSPFFRLLSGWGAATINAHRYYREPVNDATVKGL